MEKFREMTIIEKIVTVISYIILIVGVVGSIIMAFTITTDYHLYFGSELNSTGLAITIGTLFTSILLWALLRLVVEVAANVRHLVPKQ